MILMIMIPFSLHIYNNRKEDTTYQTVASFIELEQDTIKTHRQINQLEKANDKDFDKDGVYDALLVEAGKVLMDWNSKFLIKTFIITKKNWHSMMYINKLKICLVLFQLFLLEMMN